MADLLASGLSWLSEQRKAHMSASVVYRRGKDEAVVSATVGATRSEVESYDGLTVESKAVDFIIDAADLESGFGQPQQGDQIDYGGRVFEVAVLGSEAWRYTDGHRRAVRIHTKDVGSV